jgi:2-keto-4-pentenoate hydratase/2-oxohepta-3-ene-1,7-dioic acid hydratase in catechol pathway
VRLMRLGMPGQEVPVVLGADGSALDASAYVSDIDHSALATNGLQRLKRAFDTKSLETLETGAHPRIGAPVARPGKVVCIGLNYRDHARETGAPLPAEPVVFLKDPWTVQGPHDNVLVPRPSRKTDYEIELAVVIGQTARYLQSHAEALSCVAGYAISNDVSERELQLERDGQWDKGKSCETFNPMGPWLVTPDEVPDPQQLELRLSVNGSVRQHGNTSDMIFPVAEIIRFLSQVMVLYPGDVINTGTPAGVALGQPDPKPYLRDGDIVEAEIAGLGVMKHTFRQA